MTSVKELRLICQKNIKGKDIWGYYQIQRRFSIYFTWLFIRLRLTANQVTVLNMFFSLAGAMSLLVGNVLVAFALFHLYFIVDCSDGELSRYYGTSSYRGLFLDRLVHIVSEPLLFLASGIACGDILYGIVPAFCCQNGLRLIEWNYRVSEYEESTVQPQTTTSRTFMEKIARFISVYGFTFVLLLGVDNLRVVLILWSVWTPIACIYLIDVLWKQKHN